MCEALTNFVCDEKHSSRLHNGTSVLTADGAVNQHIVAHEFQLLKNHFVADQWRLFDSFLPKRFGEVCFQSIKDDLRKTYNTNCEEEHVMPFEAAMSALHSRVNRTGKLEDE